MAIIRSSRPVDNFVMVSNSMANDTSISMKAKGLLLYLLAQPPGWRTSAERITAAGIGGRDMVRAALRELEREGYLVRRRSRKEDGTWEHHHYVSDDKTAGQTSDGFSADGEPDDGQTAGGEPADSSKTVPTKTSTTPPSSTSSLTEERASSARQVHHEPRALPEDWRPRWRPDPHTWDYAVTRIEHHGVDIVAVAESMVLWARDQGREPTNALYRTFLDNARDRIIEMETKLERQENPPARKPKWYETA